MAGVRVSDELELAVVDYADPDVARLVAGVQAEYVRRYGSGDSTAVDPAQFRPPVGLFLLGRWRGEPVAIGGWRSREAGPPGLRDGDAELKRMYVVPAAQGRGFARAVLAELERTAREAGRVRVVLETGTEQPEALALYASAGYEPAPEKFGVYAHDDSSRCCVKSLVARAGAAGH